jgi:hypothetical protein
MDLCTYQYRVLIRYQIERPLVRQCFLQQRIKMPKCRMSDIVEIFFNVDTPVSGEHICKDLEEATVNVVINEPAKFLAYLHTSS